MFTKNNNLNLLHLLTKVDYFDVFLVRASNLMVTLHPFLADFLHGGPIGRPHSAERVVILHTLVDRDHASF